MSLTTAITKPLEPGFVQVEAKEKNGYVQYYKVPQKNARNFAAEYKQQDKRLSITSNVLFFGSIFAGVLGATYFTKIYKAKNTYHSVCFCYNYQREY